MHYYFVYRTVIALRLLIFIKYLPRYVSLTHSAFLWLFCVRGDKTPVWTIFPFKKILKSRLLSYGETAFRVTTEQSLQARSSYCQNKCWKSFNIWAHHINKKIRGIFVVAMFEFQMCNIIHYSQEEWTRSNFTQSTNEATYDICKIMLKKIQPELQHKRSMWGTDHTLCNHLVYKKSAMGKKGDKSI